jgi:hypothetical protein
MGPIGGVDPAGNTLVTSSFSVNCLPAGLKKHWPFQKLAAKQLSVPAAEHFSQHCAASTVGTTVPRKPFA